MEGFRRTTSKKYLGKMQKLLDKSLKVWYNISVRKRGNNYDNSLGRVCRQFYRLCDF